MIRKTGCHLPNFNSPGKNNSFTYLVHFYIKGIRYKKYSKIKENYRKGRATFIQIYGNSIRHTVNARVEKMKLILPPYGCVPYHHSSSGWQGRLANN